MEWREHISVDPNVCHGQACIKGTRVMEIMGKIPPMLEKERIVGTLWIVEEDRVRIRASSE